jgi:RimJ/RimL family protein N-acetyltransferase
MNRTIQPMDLSQAELMIDYFLSADDDFLRGMGADPNKLPQADNWIHVLEEDFSRPFETKRLYYITWMADDVPIGHSNINNIVFGQEAFVHLHIWQSQHRRSGSAEFYLASSIERYFEQFDLKKLCCEPFADNLAPNKVLPKVGFQLIRSYEATPGTINFHQRVNRWELERKLG